MSDAHIVLTARPSLSLLGTSALLLLCVNLPWMSDAHIVLTARPSLSLLGTSALLLLCVDLYTFSWSYSTPYIQGGSADDVDSNSKTPRMLALGRRHKTLVKYLDTRDTSNIWDWRYSGIPLIRTP